MDTSDHYIVVEKMIRQGEVSKPELQLALVGSRDRMTDIAAKWLAARVVRRTFPATIQLGNGGVEPIVEGPDVCSPQVSSRFENSLSIVGHGIHFK